MENKLAKKCFEFGQKVTTAYEGAELAKIKTQNT